MTDTIHTKGFVDEPGEGHWHRCGLPIDHFGSCRQIPDTLATPSAGRRPDTAEGPTIQPDLDTRTQTERTRR